MEANWALRSSNSSTMCWVLVATAAMPNWGSDRAPTAARSRLRSSTIAAVPRRELAPLGQDLVPILSEAAPGLHALAPMLESLAPVVERRQAPEGRSDGGTRLLQLSPMLLSPGRAWPWEEA